MNKGAMTPQVQGRGNPTISPIFPSVINEKLIEIY